MKRTSVGNGLYVDERGQFYVRTNNHGRRSWKRIQTDDKELALHEAEELNVASGINGSLPSPLRHLGHMVKSFAAPKIGRGIYFLILKGRCVYVGLSRSSIGNRVLTHLADKQFDRILFLRCEDNLDAIERHFIGKLEPLYNRKNYKNAPVFTKQEIVKLICGGTLLDSLAESGRRRKPRKSLV